MEAVLWAGFIVVILGLLALDLGVFHRRGHQISLAEALLWTGFWVTLALLFNVLVYFMYEHHWLGIGEHIGKDLGGGAAALQYLTGYLIEKSLSLDNIFVMALIFNYFKVDPRYQHRVLFWGIVGALILRGAMILAGTALLERFDWMIYAFGGLLLISAVKMLFAGDKEPNPDKNPLVRLARRVAPVTEGYQKDYFFVRQKGKLYLTPMFLVLLIIESTDVVFAVDSIPAVFAVTRDPFLVFTSNVFAILGLRSLYFALAGLLHRFKYLKISLVVLLGFVGIKMILAEHWHMPIWLSLATIVGILTGGIIASVLATRTATEAIIEPITVSLADIAETAWTTARKIIVAVIGGSIVLVGIALLVLPGPGLVVIGIGLGVLAVEFAWARIWLRRIRRGALDLSGKIKEKFSSDNKKGKVNKN